MTDRTSIVTDEMVEMAIDASGILFQEARDAIEAVATAIRKAALEEAAKVADDHAEAWGLAQSTPAIAIAAAIRALSEEKP